MLRLLLLALVLLTSPRAWSGEVSRRALVVGVNDGGVDLEELAHAETDAGRMADVLRELGGFDPEDVVVLSSPDRAELLDALGAMGAGEDGESDLFLFYYSGHADTRGLRLGSEIMSWAAVKESIRAIPAEVHLGILDACRSGQITRIKGAVVAAPFLDDGGLDAEGEAWIAASSADEEAQESDRLGGSFFTHYLVSGLRGAADTGDGQVSLAEAYRYAYDRTVSRTAGTQGGTQHPEYAFELHGNGELPLTDLRQATAKVVLTEDDAGEITVLSLPDLRPVAEVAKAPGHAVELALPPGRYRLIRRLDGDTSTVTVGLDAGASQVVDRWGAASAEVAAAKGPGELRRIGLGVDLLPLVGASGAGLGRERRVISINIVGGYAGAVSGVELGSAFNIDRRYVHGVQASAVNVNLGELVGIQLGVVNLVGDRTHGAQLAAVNFAGGDQLGLQLGACNLAVDGSRGVQLSAANLATGHMVGAQLGVVNITGKARGLQLGVVNYASALRGVQLGLVNLSARGGLPFMVGLNVGFARE